MKAYRESQENVYTSAFESTTLPSSLNYRIRPSLSVLLPIYTLLTTADVYNRMPHQRYTPNRINTAIPILPPVLLSAHVTSRPPNICNNRAFPIKILPKLHLQHICTQHTYGIYTILRFQHGEIGLRKE